jgi:hypothetical protein
VLNYSASSRVSRSWGLLRNAFTQHSRGESRHVNAPTRRFNCGPGITAAFGNPHLMEKPAHTATALDDMASLLIAMAKLGPDTGSGRF